MLRKSHLVAFATKSIKEAQWSKLGLVTESFVKGGGKGGQKVNKSNNKVVLTHPDTGIVVHCHAMRSLDANRKRARSLLMDKLDVRINGDQSKRGKEIEKMRKRKAKQRSRAAKKYK